MGSITTSSGTRAAETLMWIRWGDADYLGARLLLLVDLLVQGSALANTAIEKYLKAICCQSGMKVPRGHEVDRIYKGIKVQAVPHALNLNEEYLGLLSKAYRLRYPDDLEEGFNLALNQVKLLSQLDRSVLEITQRFRIMANGKTVPMVLDEAKANNDRRYLDKNVAVDPAQTGALFSSPSKSYDIRNRNDVMMEAHYKSLHIKDDLVFDVPGVKPDPKNAASFSFGFPPLVQP